MNRIESDRPDFHVTDNTSLNLILRIKRLEPDAWQKLVELYGPLIFYWCRRRQIPEFDAADVVQDVFSQVAANIEKFRRDRPGDTFRGWLRVIVRNQIIQYFRKKSRGTEIASGSAIYQLVDPESDPSSWKELLEDNNQDSDSLERSTLFRRCLGLVRAEFSPGIWNAFWLAVVEQKTHQEIAERLGISPQSVRQAKYRVLKRLREEFADVLQ